LNILFLGRNSGTSSQRKEAMLRLGHQVVHIDPYALLPSNRGIHLWEWHAGSMGLAELLRRRALQTLPKLSAGHDSFDVAWVEQGNLISRRFVKDLKAQIPRVLCYTIDDPFGGRDRMRWHQFFRALPSYDLLVVVRACNVREAYDRGARKVLRVFMSADEIAHAPRQLTDDERRQWQSEVVFVGTAFPERGPFLAELVKLSVPLTLYGNRYQRLPQWPTLRPHWRPANTESPEDYAKAISAAKVCLGLLSKGNRDEHTTRSMEIPSLGALLCAERTPEHLALYEEDREAVLWSTPQECASKCLALLNDAQRREAIATAGRQRYLSNPWRNMAVVETILNAAISSSAPSERVIARERIPETGGMHGKLAVGAGTGPAEFYGDSPNTR
jgi:spore maturation protein CgeB